MGNEHSRALLKAFEIASTVRNDPVITEAMGDVSELSDLTTEGSIIWYVNNVKNIDQSEEGLNAAKNILKRMLEIKTSAEHGGNVQGNMRELEEMFKQKDQLDVFQLFRIALEAEFRCAKCGNKLAALVKICLCQLEKRANQPGTWTCHCLKEGHDCCT